MGRVLCLRGRRGRQSESTQREVEDSTDPDMTTAQREAWRRAVREGKRVAAEVKEEEEDEKEQHQLIPGLLDEITTKHIATKVAWRALPMLELTSSKWLHVIRDGRALHEARVQSRVSGETFFVVLLDVARFIPALGVYFPGNDALKNSTMHLPPLPKPFCATACRVVASGAVIYLLFHGQRRPPNRAERRVFAFDRAETRVFAFDLAERRTWRRCANMGHPRLFFGCGMLGGKIYAVGGHSANGPVMPAEVYDPATDEWMEIATPPSALKEFQLDFALGPNGQSPPRATTPCPRYEFQVMPVVERLFVVTGEVCQRIVMEVEWNSNSEIEDGENQPPLERTFAQVYDPRVNEWVVLHDFSFTADRIFAMDDRLFRVTRMANFYHDVMEFDEKELRWRHWRTFEVDIFGGGIHKSRVQAVVGVAGIIFVEAKWKLYVHGRNGPAIVKGIAILKGRPSPNPDVDSVRFQRTNLDLRDRPFLYDPFMVPVQA